MEPPTHIEIEGEGEDLGRAGHFVQRSVVDLREVSDDEVEVSYRSNVEIVGKLAMFGDWIMKVKAKKVEEDFTKALQERLSQLS
jgi:carbon monoxide dehydrogenase subunit G